MRKLVTKTSKSIKETSEIAAIFLEEILNIENPNQGALVVGLVGDLGAGKTAFFQTVAKHLGVKGRVSSPTFVIMKKYPIKNKQYNFLFHLDAYRLKNEEELLLLGWEEILDDEKNIIFIEWPQNVLKVMPPNTKFVHISEDENGQKFFEFKKVFKARLV
ncbi:MAG: tRNA (adenosine(37)-N6)-threonylcarbamoyltransferase complex ATPase subunit type 1 TsaE [Candidatus Pacebacteria bacterium]|nr:tRNA (adenosine(37)-N6)-threonylcarbamoyltransferase complex ATPase subunit type 1 TsaE [Candidatus Paceibacterota bacterium]